jgi:hypothetical protein
MVVLLALIGVLVVDGAAMYGAHREAVQFADDAVGRAAQTFVDSGGSDDVVHQVIKEMAASEGFELVELSYHHGTTRWYEVTVKAQPSSLLLNHLPLVKEHLAQQSTAIAHF